MQYNIYNMAEDGAFNAILDVLQDEVNEGDASTSPFAHISHGGGMWEEAWSNEGATNPEYTAWTKDLINFICRMVAEGHWVIDPEESRYLDHSRPNFPDFYVWVCLRDESGRKITLKLNSAQRMLSVFGLN